MTRYYVPMSKAELSIFGPSEEAIDIDITAKTVYVLEIDEELVAIYSTKELAEEAKATKFKDDSGIVSVSEIELDKLDYWKEKCRISWG